MEKRALESTFQNQVKRDLECIPNSLVIKVQQTAICGHPDIMFFCNHLSFFIELKRSRTHKARELQKYVLKKANNAGVFAFVAYPENWRGVLLFIHKMCTAKTTVYKGYLDDYNQLREDEQPEFYSGDTRAGSIEIDLVSTVNDDGNNIN